MSLKEQDQWIPRYRPLSEIEIQSYVAAADPELQDVANLVLDLGLRLREVLRLRAQDVDLKANILHVRKPNNSKADRHVLLLPSSQKILRRRIEKGSEWLFATPEQMHNAYAAFAILHNRALEKARLEKFSMYRLRRHCATRLLAAGASIQDVSRALGGSGVAIEAYRQSARVNSAHSATRLYETRSMGRVLSDVEVERYLQFAHQDLHDCAVLILEAGLRPGEVTQLRRADVDLSLDTVRIRTRHNPAKDGPGLSISLTPKMKDILGRRLRGHSAWLFPSPIHGHRPRSAFGTLHITALAKANLKRFPIAALLCTFEARHLALGISREQLTQSLKPYRRHGKEKQ